jgi:helix-turn-helix protein
MSESRYTRPTPAGDRIASRPENIRALTHPLRLRLLALFRDEEIELTATQCAQHTGESVASCSFHLRQLEKYGYVERVGTRGKERPWRAVSRAWSVRPDLDDPEAVGAAKAFAGLWLSEQIEVYRRWLDRVDREDPSWLAAATSTSQEFWATRDELDDLSRALEQLTERFSGRNDPTQRPAGARRAHLLGAAWAEIPQEEQS